LHLSDLHFGARGVSDKEAYLSARLHEVAPTVNRVIITGDLFNNPNREEAIAFRNFRASLARLTGKDAIVIPGNHDQKWCGVRNSMLGELANLEWSSLVIDDEMQCMFFCFDSSREAELSRGKVTTTQMVDVATLFETKAVTKPEVRRYLHVAAIHHHPFSFETSQETWLQQLLGKFGLTDEYFLRMENGDEFVTWCGKRGIPLVLHGHKHVQRHVTKTVTYQEGRGNTRREVTSVGCGASLGVEGYPLSYNILGWDPVSKCWSAEFFADPGDGSGFTQQYVALHAISDP
jgi:3',5'-cyclic AMP phosphodiesterase CpdA